MSWEWAIALASIISAVGFGYLCHVYLTRVKAESALQKADDIIRRGKQEAESIVQAAQVKAKDIVIQTKERAEKNLLVSQKKNDEAELRVTQREAALDRKQDFLDNKEANLESKARKLSTREDAVDRRDLDLHKQQETLSHKLEALSGLTEEEARQRLLTQVEQELKSETGILIRRAQDEAREMAEHKARKIITTAIQRYAADQVQEVTTSTVTLPSDDMKGRIIGTAGRNIRSLQDVMGVDILIDDTPEMVVISAFDPLRREKARIALERLVADGRIHPAQIEKIYAKVETEMDEAVHQAGEEAVAELGLHGLAPEIVQTVGRLRYRHSYTQNVLRHSIEMAHLMATMAGELKLDPAIARRIGLLHDIGKALDHEEEGGHALIGAELLERYGEDPVVVNAVAAHHGDVEQKSLYATLCVAADAITAARPGARASTTDVYLRRLKDLENIAKAHDGVEDCYAIQAGRELRVIVSPDKIDDARAMDLARCISREIEKKLQFPGQIKVTVIRETRCVEFAN